jgi:hypothetical protein
MAPEEKPLTFDEMVLQMEADEAADALQEAEYLSIGDYARARGIRPQVVHYYLAKGKIKRHRCICNRWVINVKEANAAFEETEKRRNKSGVTVEEEDAGD